MEEIGTTNPKHQWLHHLCAHSRKTIPLAPIHWFTKQIVPSRYQESLVWSHLIFVTWVFRMRPINSFPSIKKYFRHPSFFSSHTFLWATWTTARFFQTIQIIRSFFNRFQPNLYQHFPWMLYLSYYFQSKANAWMYLRKGYYTAG